MLKQDLYFKSRIRQTIDKRKDKKVIGLTKGELDGKIVTEFAALKLKHTATFSVIIFASKQIGEFREFWSILQT